MICTFQESPRYWATWQACTVRLPPTSSLPWLLSLVASSTRLNMRVKYHCIKNRLQGSHLLPLSQSKGFLKLKIMFFLLKVYKKQGAKIQLLDLPGIIEGAKDGKGRGRQVCVMKFVCKSTSFPCLGYRSGTNRQHHLYCAGRAEASRPQENLGERVGRVRDPNEQGSTQHHLQEEGQGWNQPANHGASVRAGSWTDQGSSVGIQASNI